MKSLLFLLVFHSQVYAATEASSIKIEYREGQRHFIAEKSKKILKFTNAIGERELKIRRCNEELVDRFWSGMLQRAQSVKAKGLKSKTRDIAWVKVQGVKAEILDFEPAYVYFQKASFTADVVFLESRKLCKN